MEADYLKMSKGVIRGIIQKLTYYCRTAPEAVLKRWRPRRWWREFAQRYELEFHRKWLSQLSYSPGGKKVISGGKVPDEVWRRENRGFFVALSGDEDHLHRLVKVGIDEFIRENGNDWRGEFKRLWGEPFRGRHILDVGCGSRVRTSVFEESLIYCIEPLAEQYRILNHSVYELPNLAALYPVPAEEFIHGLAGTQDLVLCENVLNHCFDWKAVLENIGGYLKAGGRLILGTDLWEDNVGHLPISGGRDAIVSHCRERGLELEKEFPTKVLGRDFVGIFVKRGAP